MVIFFLNLSNYIIVNGIGLAAQTARNAYQVWERAGIQFQNNKTQQLWHEPSQFPRQNVKISS